MRGFSFSWRRALGISAAQGRLSRAIGIPLSKSGRQRKIGRMGAGALASLLVEASTRSAKRSRRSTPPPSSWDRFLNSDINSAEASALIAHARRGRGFFFIALHGLGCLMMGLVGAAALVAVTGAKGDFGVFFVAVSALALYMDRRGELAKSAKLNVLADAIEEQRRLERAQREGPP